MVTFTLMTCHPTCKNKSNNSENLIESPSIGSSVQHSSNSNSIGIWESTYSYNSKGPPKDKHVMGKAESISSNKNRLSWLSVLQDPNSHINDKSTWN
jgi:hypothetical protein